MRRRDLMALAEQSPAEMVDLWGQHAALETVAEPLDVFGRFGNERHVGLRRVAGLCEPDGLRGRLRKPVWECEPLLAAATRFRGAARRSGAPQLSRATELGEIDQRGRVTTLGPARRAAPDKGRTGHATRRTPRAVSQRHHRPEPSDIALARSGLIASGTRTTPPVIAAGTASPRRRARMDRQVNTLGLDETMFPPRQMADTVSVDSIVGVVLVLFGRGAGQR